MINTVFAGFFRLLRGEVRIITSAYDDNLVLQRWL